MHGAPALPDAFERFPYVDPEAVRGGRLVLGVQGSFDALNPFTIKGLTAAHGVSNLTVEPLMRRSLDEPFTLYPLIAESVAVPEDRSSVTFRLDPRARFSDGAPVTAADVAFSFELLRERGRPNFREYYGKVAGISVGDPRTVRFDLSGSGDRELPLILGLMPVLAKHATDPARFEETGYEALLGSGPYRVAETRRGESVTYRRDPAWWGADLPVNRFTFNFDEIRYDYYRDATSLFEAFKAGLYDLRFETDPGRWISGYGFPLARDGFVRRETVADPSPAGMTGFVFNTRIPLFADPRVREALGLMLDEDWINEKLFSGLYRPTRSYFEGSELSAAGLRADEPERRLLGPFVDSVRDDILEGRSSPTRARPGRERAAAALRLLAEAGYASGGRAIMAGTNRPLSFEILAATREQERLALVFAASLSRIGVEARVRQADPIGYQRRRQTFDFDMLIAHWPVSLSPGNEQSFRWGSAAADQPGSLNLPGVRSPAIDAALEALVAARTRPELVTAGRVLDRLLLSGFYVAPLHHPPALWLAYRSDLRRPKAVPKLGIPVELWWRP